MYPSIQAKIWGSIGQVPELIDMVLDNFIHRSVQSGLGSPMVEIMADTAVALASANVQLVAKKVIGRLCRVSAFILVPREIDSILQIFRWSTRLVNPQRNS